MRFETGLIAGGVLVVLLCVHGGSVYRIPLAKRLVIGVCLLVFGVLGTVLMAYLESGKMGRSYYGAVFLGILVMPLMARILHVPAGQVMDLSALSAGGMLVVMKMSCYYNRCCAGRVIGYDAFGDGIRFPSQIVEGAAAVLITLVLLVLFVKKKHTGTLYPLFLVIYGCTRFVLNFLRETSPFVLFIPAGHLWSILSIVIGTCWLTGRRKES